MPHGIIRPKPFATIISHATAVGNKEHKGPLGDLFDYHDATDLFGQKSWEQAEGEMQRIALNLALSKRNQSQSALDAVFAGDLINQCSSSNYGLLDIPAPFIGLYGACSTSAEGLIVASLYLSATDAETVAVVTSSHNCSAERQFRFPLEYGGQRPPTAQWTVTGAAAFILGHGDGAYITELLPGISIDEGITDANNMGAAMAPAVLSTLTRYFEETGHVPADFDGIYTGDLGYEGHGIVIERMKKKGYDLSMNCFDCGLLIYDREGQDVHAGGSGCGCSATVLSSYLLPKLESGEFHDILYIATGALMSPMAIQQGKSIPGIAHLVRLTKERGL
jgi:stage V sporulation protein AD